MSYCVVIKLSDEAATHFVSQDKCLGLVKYFNSKGDHKVFYLKRKQSWVFLGLGKQVVTIYANTSHLEI